MKGSPRFGRSLTIRISGCRQGRVDQGRTRSRHGTESGEHIWRESIKTRISVGAEIPRATLNETAGVLADDAGTPRWRRTWLSPMRDPRGDELTRSGAWLIESSAG